ncbi:MAG: DUF2158 domain-containing protein [Proteobacteria bacterium]|nr:DUF2158 domain-containing protein [Pseudomonadota bacterium]
MAENLKVGDIVKLKSGGPRMTVTLTEGDGPVECKWFENYQGHWTGPFEGNFLPEALEK